MGDGKLISQVYNIFLIVLRLFDCHLLCVYNCFMLPESLRFR